MPQLCGDYGTVAVVYAKFYTQYGVASEVVSDSIVYVSEVSSNPTPDLTPTPDLSIPNGSLVKAVDDFKIYIINNNYIRHIIDEIIFSFYNHLNWNAIQEIDSSQLNNYEESYLIREIDDYRVYEIRDGKKYWLDVSVEEFDRLGYEWEEVYVVNEEERDWYETEL